MRNRENGQAAIADCLQEQLALERVPIGAGSGLVHADVMHPASQFLPKS